ncbi:hypothetical protein [Sphingobium olei]
MNRPISALFSLLVTVLLDELANARRLGGQDGHERAQLGTAHKP